MLLDEELSATESDDTRPERLPNPRATHGVPSTPARRALVAKYQDALPPTSRPTTGESPRALVDAIQRAAACPPAQLAVLHVRATNVSSAVLQYAAFYQRHVARNDCVALELPNTRPVRLSLDCPPGDLPREVLNKVGTPELFLAETIAVVEWPPPPSLSGASLTGYIYKPASSAFLHIQKKEEEEEEGDDDDESEQAACEASPSEDGDASHAASEDGNPSHAEASPSEDGNASHAEASPSSDADAAQPIFVAPYTLDESDDDDPRKFSVILATPGPHDALVTFAADILEWHAEVTRAEQPRQTHYYGLFRLRKSHWVHETDRRARKIESVFLPRALRADLVDDARRFFSDRTSAWYIEHGVPYRRAYMFHGPPGTGKTSMIKALASDLRRNACFVSMTHSLAPEDVADALADLPERPLLVIEDVDALFRAADAGRELTKMTFSALLNVLDGMMSADGVLTIMTTNHVTRIDPIALRAGRVDRLFFFGPAEDEVLRDCFRYFYKDASADVVDDFVRVVRNERDAKARSIATLQEHFIEMRENSAEECVQRLPEFIENYVNRAKLLKRLEEQFKEDTGTEGTPFMLDGEKVNKYAESEHNSSRPNMFG